MICQIIADIILKRNELTIDINFQINPILRLFSIIMSVNNANDIWREYCSILIHSLGFKNFTILNQSKGGIGNILNTAKAIFTWANNIQNISISSHLSWRYLWVNKVNTIPNIASIIFVKGPANATINSSLKRFL